MRFLSTFLFFVLYGQISLLAQIKQEVIKGSDSNVIYQSFYSQEGGELQTIKISTDQIGEVSIKLFEDDKTYSSENPIWEVNKVKKDKSGALIINFDEGQGITNLLEPNKKYCFSIVGGGNIHHSFLDDVYPGGNYRFEDGIERTGDLFFEINISPDKVNSIKEEIKIADLIPNDQIVVFPNPTSNEISIRGIKENATVAVFDNEGKLILQQGIQAQEKLRLDHLLDGTYFLRITSEGKVYVKKIIKADK